MVEGSERIEIHTSDQRILDAQKHTDPEHWLLAFWVIFEDKIDLANTGNADSSGSESTTPGIWGL
jgi:hypothetical protein